MLPPSTERHGKQKCSARSPVERHLAVNHERVRIAEPGTAVLPGA